MDKCLVCGAEFSDDIPSNSVEEYGYCCLDHMYYDIEQLRKVYADFLLEFQEEEDKIEENRVVHNLEADSVVIKLPK
jgi:hypothetical protein